MVATILLTNAGADTPHPRPDFERAEWLSLNGVWEFQFAPENREGTAPLQVSPLHERPYEGTIRVPFGWDSKLSGVQRTDYKGEAWYRREFSVPANWLGKRIWLCFGAVDYRAEVWVNGQRVGQHEGGYSEFRLDITPQVRYDRPNTLVVVAEDLTDHETPIGKQTPSWYTSTSGIWQTVWLETTGQAYVRTHQIICEADDSGAPNGKVQITVEVDRGGVETPLSVEIRSTERQFPAVRTELAPNTESATLTLTVPGARLWTPETPHLYPFEIRLLRGSALEDTVQGYFGIRTVLCEGGPTINASLILEGITCAACVWLNETHLARQKGITAVEVNPDLEHAKVYFSLLTGESAEVTRALQKAAGFLRTELSRRMRLRSVPQLHFLFDESLERGNRISHLIDEAIAEDERHHRDD